MVTQFAAIFDQELKKLGVAPSSSFTGKKVQQVSASQLPAILAPSLPKKKLVSDRTDFSLKAKNLSCSLQHYAHDALRPHHDPTVIAGWEEVGYLRKQDANITGKIQLTTASGCQVYVEASDHHESVAGTGLFVSVTKNGVSHRVRMEDFTELYGEIDTRPLRALEASASSGAAQTPTGPTEQQKISPLATLYTQAGQGRIQTQIATSPSRGMFAYPSAV